MAVFNVKNFNLITASMINWMANNQTKITDFNKGGVARTLLETVALEIEELYFRVYQALGNSIAESVYTAFDFPKIPPVRATGTLQFFKRSPGNSDVTIPLGTGVQTEDGKRYTTTEAGILRGSRTFESVEFVFTGSAYRIKLDVLEGDARSFFNAGDTVTVSGSALTLPGDPNNKQYEVVGATFSGGFTFVEVNLPFQPGVEDAFLATTGETTIELNARAEQYGEDYNVEINKVIRLSSPVLVDGVTNITPFTGGTSIESDASRKSRFALYLNSLSQGTLPALEFAAINVPGVVSARAIDNQPIYALVYERTLGGPQPPGGPNHGSGSDHTDYSEQVNTPYAQAVPLLDFGLGAGQSAVVFGLPVQTDTIYIDLSVKGVQGGVPASPTTGTWQYYSGVTNDFVDIPLTDITDETEGLTKTGSVILDISGSSFATQWTNVEFLDGDSDYAQGQYLFPIRFLETPVAGDQLIVQPESVQVFTKPEPGAVHLYIDPEEVAPNVEAAVETVRSGGILVRVFGPVEKHVTISVAIRVSPLFDATSVVDLVTSTLVGYASNLGLGSAIFNSEIIQYLMNLQDQAILDVNILQLGDSVAPNISDVIASPNQQLIVDATDVTVTVI